MTRRLSLRSAAVIAALPLALAACGDGQGTTAGTDAPTSASAEQTPAGEGPFSAAAGQEVDIDQFVERTSKAVSDKGTYAMHTTADMSGSSLEMTGSADISEPENPKMMGAIDMGGQKMDMILVDKKMYLQMAGLGDGKYIAMPLEELLQGNDAALESMFNQQQQLETQKNAIKSITYQGSTTDNGTELFQYTVEIDPQAIQEAAGATSAPEPTSNPSGAPGVPSKFDYYLDSEALMHKVVTNDPSFTSETTYSDYGKPVTITAPPTSQVTSLPGLGSGTQAPTDGPTS